jgi:hypothetical protein
MDRNQALHGAAKLLEEFESLDSAAPGLLKHLGFAFDCGWAALWEADLTTGSLRIVGTWQDPSIRSDEFKDFTNHWNPGYGEGIVGKAWRTLQPQFSRNLVQDMSLPRSLLAKNAGLESGVWVPIQSRRGAFVLECMLRSQPDQELIPALQRLAILIAEFVDRTGKR